MAKITLERLKESNQEKYPSNTLIDYYDIIHKLSDALASLEGIKFKGDGAHIQLIEYVGSKYLNTHETVFLQDMRDFRNRIHYEGFAVNSNYISSNVELIEKIILKLEKSSHYFL
jgi:hypothetical protein